MLGRHIQLPYARPVSERVSALARPLWAVQAVTAVSRRERRRDANSVNIVRNDASAVPRACVVERCDLGGAGYALTDSTRIRLSR